jgi:hypothetical protein
MGNRGTKNSFAPFSMPSYAGKAYEKAGKKV